VKDDGNEEEMPDAEAINAAINAHCQTLSDQDKDGWLALWADNAVLEDPVGVDTFRGIESIGTTFWKMVEDLSPMKLWLERDVIVCGNEAIAILHGVVTRKGAMQHVGPLVDHFTFNPEGKITMMRAFWKYA
jgi:steroid Delta-isomerase